MTSRDALLDTRQAFDGVAADYDQSNESNPIIRWMRSRMIAAVTSAVPAGGCVLDLGCGPGRDAVTLGAAGYRVTAIDWSAAMAAETSRRVAEAGLGDRVTVQPLGIQHLDRLGAAHFDAAYSNLGPLNCIPDLDDAAQSIAARLKPGGALIASVIGRFCPWEFALYASRGEWQRANIRFADGLVPVPLQGRRIWTRYMWPSEFFRAFYLAGFRMESVSALGLFAPPPYLDHAAARFPRALSALMTLDDIAGRWPVLRNGGDHFLMVLRLP